MPSTFKLIGAGVAALILLALVADRVRWMHRAHNAEGQVAAGCTATREAAANPKLSCGRMPEQIRLLGTVIKDLKVAVATQNAAIDALGAKSKADQAAAASAAKAAEKRSQGAEATAERLRASARSPVPSRVCEASKAVQESWR